MAAKINKRFYELVMVCGCVESVRDDLIVYEWICLEVMWDVIGVEIFVVVVVSVARYWWDFFVGGWSWFTASSFVLFMKGEKVVLFLKKLKCYGVCEYDKFVNIMNMYKYNFLSVWDVDREVVALLSRYSLLREFRETFLRFASVWVVVLMCVNVIIIWWYCMIWLCNMIVWFLDEWWCCDVVRRVTTSRRRDVARAFFYNAFFWCNGLID